MNYESGVCSFEDEQFANLLKYAKTLNTEHTENYGISECSSVASGNRLYSDILIENPLNIQELETESGAELSFLGYPSSESKNGSFAYLIGLIGVNANTKHSAEAWEFIKFLIDNDEVQINAAYTSIPIKKTVLESQIDAFQHPYRQYEGKKITENDDGTFNVDGVYQDRRYNPNPAMTERQLNKFYKILNEAQTPYEFDKEIYEIITECAAGYFSNDRSLEQTISDIQSRVSIYLSEQG